jgi:2'-5' RNA ligase
MTFSRFLVESGKIKRDYSSIQLDLPERLADEIISWGYDNIPEKSVFFNPDRPSFGREDNIHITVLYGIAGRDTISGVESILKDTKPFSVRLGKLSLFSNQVFDVLKIDVDSPDLHHMNSILVKNLDVAQTYPKYIPHVTIAYLNKNKGEKYKGLKEFEGEKFQVNSLIFSSKDGTKHKIKLGASDE